MLEIYQVHSQTDIERCADIWLKASIAGHPFVPTSFWEEQRYMMTEHYIPLSTTFIACENTVAVGFSSTRDNTLEALFSLPACWGKGIGTQLVHHLFTQHSFLELTVYQNNSRAISFYERLGFITTAQQLCPHTNESELVMQWHRP